MRSHSHANSAAELFAVVTQPATANEPVKKAEQFRDYEAELNPKVKEFYRLNHTSQTFEFVLAQKKKYNSKNRRRMGIWEALELLNTLIDESDPDTELPQIEHALQTAEAIRRDHHPDWFVLTGLIHDLGKVLSFYGEPQWAVVGDTYPVGCLYSKKNVFPAFFTANADFSRPEFQTANGVYEAGCGLDRVHFSWGHDEYLFQVVKDFLPEESLYMIRYHSCYVIHREGAYQHLMNDHDRKMFEWVRALNPYDLYSKSAARPSVAALRPYYEDLISRYFPPQLDW